MRLLTLRIFAVAAAALAVNTAAVAVDLTDAEVENIVRRSYQYLAMYNVNNKFAMKQGGWNTVDADTNSKITPCGRLRGPIMTRFTSALCWICARTR